MGMSDWLRQVLAATRFLSRLPLPDDPAQGRSLGLTLRAAPWAGVLIGLGPALVLMGGAWIGLPALASVTLAIATLVFVTGGLHEDGLADVADGFGGGATVSRKLAIMRDSRIGAFGAVALGLGLLLRVAGLQALVERTGAGRAALALVAAAALSRGLMLLPLVLLPAARPGGLAQAARNEPPSFAFAFASAGLLGLVLGWPVAPDRLQVVAALVAALAAACGVTRMARHHLRGVTGDVLGATQQVAEITFLLTLSAGAIHA